MGQSQQQHMLPMLNTFEEAVSEALQRRTAEHAATSTEARPPMTEPFDRPLHDPERQLLVDLAVRELAAQANCALHEANDALAELARRGELLFVGDAKTVRVENSAGGWLVEAARDWLAWTAGFGGNDPWGTEEEQHDG